MTTRPTETQQRQRAAAAGQEGLFRFWNELDLTARETLLEQVSQIDFDQMQQLWNGTTNTPGCETAANTPAARAARATSPSRLVRVPTSQADKQRQVAAREEGNRLLQAGRVGAILVAGGEGSRLGFPHPKGMYPIAPLSQHSLFQIFAEQLLERGRRAGRSIPYCIMTSDTTDSETRTFFETHHYFGLDPADVMFFRQGTMPAVDRKTGEILLASKGTIARNPDGHGGMLTALNRSGCLAKLRERGIDFLYYHQVDNPISRVCDPEFLGYHIQEGASVSTKVIAKRAPSEKMGVLVDLDGKTEIIEYSDLSVSDAERRMTDGSLVFWAGSTAIHVFNRSSLEQLSSSGSELPFHRAIKKVPFVDHNGILVEPTTENAIKYERFIFDVLPLAGIGLGVEALREDEFCPLKNKSGDFSAEHVRQSMHELHASWLREHHVAVPNSGHVEISARIALSSEDLDGKTITLPASGPLLIDERCVR